MGFGRWVFGPIEMVKEGCGGGGSSRGVGGGCGALARFF